MARSGTRWRDPRAGRLASYQTAKRRYYRWIEVVVFDRLFAAVAADPDLEWLAVDATVTLCIPRIRKAPGRFRLWTCG